jgi:hypothetical protein
MKSPCYMYVLQYFHLLYLKTVYKDVNLNPVHIRFNALLKPRENQSVLGHPPRLN